VWVIKDANGNKVTEIGANQLKDLSNPNGTGLIQVIKDPVKQYTESIMPLSGNIFNGEQVKDKDGKVSLMPNGTINESFLTGPVLEKPAPGTKKVVNGKEVATEKIEYRTVDLERIKQDPNLSKKLEGVADGNLTSPIDAYNQYTEVLTKLVPGNGVMTKSRLLTDEGKAEYKRAFKEYFYKTQIPPTQDLRKVPAETATVEYSIEKAKTTGRSGGTGSGGKGKPTAAQNKMWQLNKKATEQIKNNKTSAVIVDPLDTANGIQWDPNVVYKNSKQKGGWVPVTYNKDKDYWINIEGNTKAIRSRTKAAETYLRGFDAGATTIEEYFSRVNPNSEDYDGLPTYNEE